MTENVPRMPGSPGPQPRPGIDPVNQLRIAQLERDPFAFAGKERQRERTHLALDAVAARLAAAMGGGS